MPDFELFAVILALAGLLLGGLGIWWARAGRAGVQVWWGKRLFIGTLLALGGCSLVAALHRAQGLVLLGLSAGFLVVAMLWEGPPSNRFSGDAFSVAEEA